MYLTRIDPGEKMYRFYHLEIVPGLFGDWGLVREWGRIGWRGRMRTDWYDSEADAKNARFGL
ncbi:WGR domain-containing protein [Roseivivax isoporae]|uniref:WGR domain-containing protein n=1 Tax=Roseivivax isoporae LMG 25204 TaxID=1449351 RepID=X7F1A6_9RHOB|nr:WGR domain-containing protein [Roseivivax isoporae]ETX26525.1 hypothetical protein RISW2_23000 [Roseivivax isoporae LMG 25204]